MKRYEFAKLNNLVTDEDWMNFFRNNMLTGKVPVALVSCIDCDEIIETPDYICPICNPKN